MSAAPLLVSRRVASQTEEVKGFIQELRKEVDVVHCDGEGEGSGFDTASFFERLKTDRMGDVLIHSAQIPSTQNLIQKHLNAVPSGTVCVALRQSAGRGRRDNEWESPDGCLMFSIKWSFEIDPSMAPFLNYVVCLAIIRGVRTMFQNREKNATDVQIKWPNDIYYKQQKIGGVLLNSSFRGATVQLIIGIGLNVLNDKPTTCLQQIFQSQGTKESPPAKVTPLSLEETAAEVLNNLEELLTEFAESGFASMDEEYKSRWMHSDQRLALDASTSVTLKGITKNGFLLAVTDAGEEVELMPDGNTIDMMQGLIIRRASP